MPGYLYRRKSGVYVVRICIPFRLRQRIGRREIHVSTKSTEAAEAKASAFAILAAWQQSVIELKEMDVIKITEGSALFSGEGYARIEDVETQFGFGRRALINELLESKAQIFCRADGWRCIRIENIDEVEKDWTVLGLQAFEGAVGKIGAGIEDDSKVAVPALLLDQSTQNLYLSSSKLSMRKGWCKSVES